MYDSKGRLLDAGGHPSDTAAERTAVPGEGVTTYMYESERPAAAFRFEHDAAHGVFRLTFSDGTVEVFRDKPARQLRVEPDETGEMRPVVKHGRPVYLYLCREEREVR